MLLSGKTLRSLHFLEEKNAFTNKEGSDTYKIREGLLFDFNSENVIYFIICKKYKKQYVGSCITRFRTSFNNYCSWHRKFCRGHSVIQDSFQAHFMLAGHCSIDDWEMTLIDKWRNKQETRKKELLWQYKFSSFGNISLTHLYRIVFQAIWSFETYQILTPLPTLASSFRIFMGLVG